MSGQRETGFTLLEILIVIVIVGILAGMVSLTIPSDNEQKLLDEEVLRLQALLHLMHEEAILKGEAFGVDFHNKQVTFWRFDQEWKPIEDERMWRQRDFSGRYELKFELDGKLVSSQKTTQQDKQPQVVFLASGDLPLFSLELSFYDETSAETYSDRVYVNHQGVISIESREPEQKLDQKAVERLFR